MLTYHKTTEEEKYRITAWKYDGDYAVYNSTPYAQQKRPASALPTRRITFIPSMTGRTLSGSSISMRSQRRSSLASALRRSTAARATGSR